MSVPLSLAWTSIFVGQAHNLITESESVMFFYSTCLGLFCLAVSDEGKSFITFAPGRKFRRIGRCVGNGRRLDFGRSRLRFAQVGFSVQRLRLRVRRRRRLQRVARRN
jgi:hypothetical protein